MRKWIRRMLPAALCPLLCACGALLERSYSSVEPYTNRYWDSSAEDTLRAESYQDLVNSLLMLVEERAEEGAVRCYEEANSYIQVQRARSEVRRETTLGSYMLEGLAFTYESGTAYSTVTYQMTYREGAEDLEGLMSISDSQSLLDLLRLAVREEHEKLTARFSYDTPTEEVRAAVEALWQELYLGEGGENAQTLPAGEAGAAAPESPVEPEAPDETLREPDVSPPASEPEEEEGGEPGSVPDFPEEDPAQEEEDGPEAAPALGELGPEDGEAVPPCPWTIRFYPDKETAEIVEILLEGQWPKAQ